MYGGRQDIPVPIFIPLPVGKVFVPKGRDVVRRQLKANGRHKILICSWNSAPPLPPSDAAFCLMYRRHTPHDISSLQAYLAALLSPPPLWGQSRVGWPESQTPPHLITRLCVSVAGVMSETGTERESDLTSHLPRIGRAVQEHLRTLH